MLAWGPLSYNKRGIGTISALLQQLTLCMCQAGNADAQLTWECHAHTAT